VGHYSTGWTCTRRAASRISQTESTPSAQEFPVQGPPTREAPTEERDDRLRVDYAGASGSSHQPQISRMARPSASTTSLRAASMAAGVGDILTSRRFP
jgi:hypothetical protein